MEHGWVRAFAPATVANVACGFDVFGFAMEEPGDTVAVRLREETGVVLGEVTGDGGRLPREIERNTAGVAVRHLLRELGSGALPGLELRLEKGLPLASGLGSSAASAVAAVVAVDELLDLGAPRELLLAAAVEGERAATGAAHADNVAPALYGGFVLVRGVKGGFSVTELPVPPGLSCALIRPHIRIDTGSARKLLGDRVGLREAVVQWGNAAALVAGFFRGDTELIASALSDAVAEPVRSTQVPGFRAVQRAALEKGALGCSLSGSGPAIFAFTQELESARHCVEAMSAALFEAAGLSCDRLVSPVGAAGARLIEERVCVP